MKRMSIALAMLAGATAAAVPLTLAGGDAASGKRGKGGRRGRVTPSTLSSRFGTQFEKTGSGRKVRPTIPDTPSVRTDFGAVTCNGERRSPGSPAPGCTRVYEVTAQELEQKIANFPLQTAKVWGYDGSTPGPTRIAYESERVRFVVKNELPEPTTLHFHGLHQPNEDDGVPVITQPKVIQPGASHIYEFKPGHVGTFAYHSHFDSAVQEMRGLNGAFIVLPRRQHRSVRADKDVMLTLQEFEWEANGALVKPFGQMNEFGWRTINGKTGDASGGPIPIERGDIVRIRLYNASNHAHAMHLHGHDEILVAKNGHRVKPTRETTQNVAPGDFFTVEFKATNPGNWIFHCHFPHHTSNKMNAGFNGSPVGMTRIFQYEGAPKIDPRYFSSEHFKSKTISG